MHHGITLATNIATFALRGRRFVTSEAVLWQVFNLKHAQAATSDLNEILVPVLKIADMGSCRYIASYGTMGNLKTRPDIIFQIEFIRKRLSWHP